MYQNTDKKTKIIFGSIIATIIALTPYLFYLYESVPKVDTWHTFLFTYRSKAYEDVYTFIWLLTGKGVPLLLLMIWFITCRHWWHHVILIPIAMYAYQMFGIFNEDNGFIDEYQLIYIIPIMLVIVPSVYLVRAKMFDKINDTNKNIQELEDELKNTPKGFVERFKEYF